MKKILLLLLTITASIGAYAQLVSVNKEIVGPKPIKFNPKDRLTNRSATNPTVCGSDTSYFPNLSTSISGGAYQYRSLLVGPGQSLGQFYGAPQEITVSGFRFYGFYQWDTTVKIGRTSVTCKLYKAGPDSLPTGKALASTVVYIDTIGGTLYLNKIRRDAVFTTPVKCNFPYIITVESDSSSAKPAVVSNAWQYGDGEGRNLAVGSVSGKWYRCLQLNVGGVSFDAHMQFYPFVKYNFGTNFTSNLSCYNVADTLRFTNQYANTVCGSMFYNQYMYYFGFEDYCHTWTFDGTNTVYYSVDGKYKSSVKKNISVNLQSTIYQYSSSTKTCFDSTVKWIYFKPVTPALTKSANGCAGDSIKLSLSSEAGTTLNWYHKTSDPNSFRTGSSYTLYNLSKADSFYVKAVNGGCSSGFAPVYLTVNKYPTKLTYKNDSICSTASANLTASTDNGIIEWYNTKTGGTRMGTGNVYNTGSLTADTAYYAQANNNGCIYSGGRARVRALVNSSFAPSAPTGFADTTICLTGASTNVTLGAKASGTNTLRWFDVPTGGAPIATTASYTATVNSRGTTTYYVQSWNGSCGSGRSAININTNKAPSTFTKNGATICSGDSATLVASTTWGSVDWYTSKGGSVAKNGKFYTLYNQTATSNVFFKTREGKCINANYDSVKVTVNSAPAVVSTKSDDVCQKGLGSMTVNVASGNVYWYADNSTATSLYKGNTFNLGAIYSNMTYYYATESNGCYSARTPITVKMLQRPTAGFTWTLAWPRIVTCTPITTAGMTFNWAWGDGNTSTGLPASHQYNAEGNYNIELVTVSKTNVCTDTADIPVLVSHLATKNIDNPAVKIFPNPVAQNTSLTIDGIQVQSIQWYDLSGRLVSISDVINGSVKVPTNLQNGIYFIKGSNGHSSFKASIMIQ